MIDTPKLPDTALRVTPGTVTPKITGQGDSVLLSYRSDSLLNAVVARHDAQGNPILKTPAGEITVNSPLPLDNGSSIVLKVLLSQALEKPSLTTHLPFTFQAKIISIDGHLPPAAPVTSESAPAAKQPPLQPYPVITAIDFHAAGSKDSRSARESSPSAATSVAPSRTSHNQASILQLSRGVIVDALVITPDPKIAGNVTQQNLSAPVRPSDTVVLHIVSVTLPNALSGTEGVKPPVPGVLTPLSTPFVPGSPLPYKTTPPPPTILPDPAAAPIGKDIGSGHVPTPSPSAPLTTHPPLQATVIGTEKSGDIVLHTPLGILKLPPELTLPKNSVLEFEVLRSFSSQASLPITSTASPLENLVKQQQTLLQTLFVTAYGEGGQTLESARAVLPAADHQLYAKLLWFLAALKRGDEQLWLGKTLTHQLQRSDNGELLAALRGHFHHLQNLAEAPQPQQWNGLLFPVFDGEQLRHAIILTHRGRKDNGDQDQEGARFIVEVELQGLGTLQLDGFVKPHKNSKQFDLIIRTQRPLPEDMQREIREIFLETLAIMGIHGSIQFQVVTEFPVRASEVLVSANAYISSVIA